MSRSTLQKSRAEKGGGKAASSTPAIAHEIVPGKYNDQDWSGLVDHDDSEEFVYNIVEEVCASAMDIIYTNYIQRQLVPYTVTQAKDAILQIIEWQFLDRDEGETVSESVVSEIVSEPVAEKSAPSVGAGWLEDEEPAPAVTDCWAQGSVPRQVIPVSARSQTVLEEVEEEEEPAALDDSAEREDDVTQTGSEDGEGQTEQTAREAEDLGSEAAAEESHLEGGESHLEGEESHLEGEEADKSKPATDTPAEPTQPSGKTKKKKKFRPYAGRLGSAGVAKMTESLDDTEMKVYRAQQAASFEQASPNPDEMLMPASCSSMLKLQAGRPPGSNKDVLFDESGNIISVYKLDPEKLPSHKVKTSFKIIDPAVEAAQARLEAMRTGKFVSDRKVPRPPATSKTATTRHAHSVTTVTSKQSTNKDSKPFDVVPLPPPLIDTIAVAPGVTIKEGGQTRKGPKQKGKRVEVIFASGQSDLRPVQMRAQVPTLTVAELLDHQTPVIKPLAGSAPVPPISQRQIVD